MRDIVLMTVYGNFACFTMTETKIDRVSYPVPTPSACRGMLCAVYCKPDEFWYEIVGIDVLKPIKYISVMKNEVNVKAVFKSGDIAPIDVDDKRTQRSTVYLSDVAYKITAKIHVRDSFMPGAAYKDKLHRVIWQFENRVSHGKCFWQPYMGTRECMCFFRLPNRTDVPIKESADFGIMLYDIFDPSNKVPLNTDRKAEATCVPNPTYFDAKMRNGHVVVPRYDSDRILRAGRVCFMKGGHS